MKKLKLYLDTSVMSHLFADDAPDKMADTNKLWESFISEEYDISISAVVIAEINKCPEPKRSEILEKMALIQPQILPSTVETKELARAYIESGVLREKSFADCLHIAYAVINYCDAIVSWNFKHLVNFKIIDKIRVVNAINRYKAINIISPTMLIQEDNHED